MMGSQDQHQMELHGDGLVYSMPAMVKSVEISVTLTRVVGAYLVDPYLPHPIAGLILHGAQHVIK